MKRFLKELVMAAVVLGAPFVAPALDLKDGDKIAIMAGQGLDSYAWSPTGYLRLLTNEFEKAGIKAAIPVDLEGQKTAQMLARVDADVIAKKPAYVLIIPGTADYNPFAQKTVDPAFNTNLAGVVEKLKAANIKPVLVTLYAANSNPSEPRNQNTAEHNEAIRALAKEHGVTLIDFVKVIDSEKPLVPLDGSLAAKALIQQMFAGEVLRGLGASDAEITASRQAWLDIAGIQFPPSVSINTYEKLKAAAKASGKEIDTYLTEVLHANAK